MDSLPLADRLYPFLIFCGLIGSALDSLIRHQQREAKLKRSKAAYALSIFYLKDFRGNNGTITRREIGVEIVLD